VAILITILVLVLIVVVIFVISAPLRAAWDPAASESRQDADEPGCERIGGDVDRAEAAEREEDRIELEAAREAKYREIRDTELDYRTGKLSSEDFAATDSALRAEAVEILDRLERETARPKDA
jgi:hypothetical protein